MAREDWGRPRSLWRRALRLPAKRTWHDDHPLPPGWRPRTKVDMAGREVEPWLWLITDHAGEFDGGETWLPVGYDPDEAAWAVLDVWWAWHAHQLTSAQRAALQCSARRYGPDGHRVGIASPAGAITAP